MKKSLLILCVLVGATMIGCGDGPRDATNDPEVKAMLKGVEEQGKMPAQGEAPAGQAPAGGPTAVGG